MNIQGNNPKTLGERLTNWGRWMRESEHSTKTEKGCTYDEADAIRINRAVTALEQPLHRGLLARWFVLNQHKSRIASELKVPRPMLRRYYLAAHMAVIAKLQRQGEV